MDHTAISKIQETGIAAVSAAQEKLPAHATALPKDFNIHNLEPYLPGRTRFRGRFCTHSLIDFAAHVLAIHNDYFARFHRAHKLCLEQVKGAGF